MAPDRDDGRIRAGATGSPMACLGGGAGRHRSTMGKAWARANDRGDIRWDVADRLAIELIGLHPAEVWGAKWFEVDEDDLMDFDDLRPFTA